MKKFILACAALALCVSSIDELGAVRRRRRWPGGYHPRWRHRYPRRIVAPVIVKKAIHPAAINHHLQAHVQKAIRAQYQLNKNPRFGWYQRKVAEALNQLRSRNRSVVIAAIRQRINILYEHLKLAKGSSADDIRAHIRAAEQIRDQL